MVAPTLLHPSQKTMWNVTEAKTFETKAQTLPITTIIYLLADSASSEIRIETNHSNEYCVRLVYATVTPHRWSSTFTQTATWISASVRMRVLSPSKFAPAYKNIKMQRPQYEYYRHEHVLRSPCLFIYCVMENAVLGQYIYDIMACYLHHIFLK